MYFKFSTHLSKSLYWVLIYIFSLKSGNEDIRLLMNLPTRISPSGKFKSRIECVGSGEQHLLLVFSPLGAHGSGYWE